MPLLQLVMCATMLCFNRYLYLYLSTEDELVHFCWRSRGSEHTDPEIDLITIPGDATFTPLVSNQGAEDVRSPTNGRIFVLKFSSSGEKQYFWMQSKSQHKEGEPNWFSQRDQRLGYVYAVSLAIETTLRVSGVLHELHSPFLHPGICALSPC